MLSHCVFLLCLLRVLAMYTCCTMYFREYFSIRLQRASAATDTLSHVLVHYVEDLLYFVRK
jgi:hypothetical protein